MYRPGTGCTALYSCFNNWLQSVPTRYQLHSLCTAYPTQTGYRVIRPSLFNSVLILGQVDSWYLQDIASTNWLQSLRLATQPALNSLLHINRLQSLPITNQHQESPTQRSSTSWPLLISSLFTSLRLMTGLRMYSP